jgi:hypothetical protein
MLHFRFFGKIAVLVFLFNITLATVHFYLNCYPDFDDAFFFTYCFILSRQILLIYCFILHLIC